MKRKRTTKAADPLLRACDACGAGIGAACITVGKGEKRLPLVPIASRLVHGDRIEQPRGTNA